MAIWRRVLFLACVGWAAVGACAGLVQEHFIPAEACTNVQLASGKNLVLPCGNGLSLNLVLSRRVVLAGGRASYTATCAGAVGFANAVVVETAEGFLAQVSDLKTGHAYSFVRTAKGLRVTESTVTARRRSDPRKAANPRSVGRKLAQNGGSDSTFERVKEKWLARGERETNVVDVLVAYDTTAASWVGANYGEIDGLETFAEMCIAKMNLVLDNSGLGEFRFRLAGIQAVPYKAENLRTTQDGVSLIDYSRLLDLMTESTAAVWKDLRAVREAVSADVVTFLVDNGEFDESGLVGLGYSLDGNSIRDVDYFADYAYDVCSVRDVAAGYTMVHEVGHHLGAGHADYTQMNARVWDVGPQLFADSSAYYFWVPDADGYETRYHTVMGYAWDGFEGSDYAIEAPYFSTPNKTFAWISAEELSLVTNETEVTVGTPWNNNADTLRETFAIGANFRPHKTNVEVEVAFGEGKVTGGGCFALGKKIRLTATAASGFVFAGWYAQYDGEAEEFSEPLVGASDSRTTTFDYIVPNEHVVIYARFVSRADDVAAGVAIRCEPPAEGWRAGWTIEPLSVKVEALSLPTVTVKNLPSGLKYEAKSGCIVGTPKAPGVYEVSVTAKDAAGAKGAKTVTLTVANKTDELISASAGCKDGLVDRYGPFIPGAPVDLTLSCAKGWSVKGLPAGLKFDAKTGRVTGTPTKPGASTVYFTTKVVDPATKKNVAHEATATFVVDALRVLAVKIEGTGTGKVTGAGNYVANKKVTLKATADTKDDAAKGTVKSVFAGWYNGETLLTKAASFSYVVTTAAEQVLRARFVTAVEDAASIELSVAGMALSDGEGAVWTNRCGVCCLWSVVAGAISETTVKATGLPAGLKLVQDKATRAYSVTGTPTAASKLKDGQAVPSMVKFTVTTAGKSSSTFTQPVLVVPLDSWAQGTFTGYAEREGETDGKGVGPASLTITASGGISGKCMVAGTNWTIRATGYQQMEANAEGLPISYCLIAEAKNGKNVENIKIDVVPGDVTESRDFSFCSAASLRGEGLQGCLRRTIWKDRRVMVEFPTTPQRVLNHEGVQVKISSSGTATFSGKLENGVKISATGVVQIEPDRSFWTWLIVPATKDFAGLCEKVPLAAVK